MQANIEHRLNKAEMTQRISKVITTSAGVSLNRCAKSPFGCRANSFRGEKTSGRRFHTC